jgi:hypothetical protein
VAFLTELVSWGRSAPEEIFSPNKNTGDIYASVRPVLGPWHDGPYRRAVMLEVMRVLGGFESDWNWNEGVDKTNKTSMANVTGQETGLWQVSYDSLPFGDELKKLSRERCAPNALTPQNFIAAMKRDHDFAMEYISRLLRRTCRANGPVLRHEIDKWLRVDSVLEFEGLLS